MDGKSIAARVKAASVALLCGAGLTIFPVGIGTASATPAHANGFHDDLDSNTRTCRQAYPHWDNPTYLDVWFERDDSNNPICKAETEGSDNPVTLCWPAGKAVVVISDERQECDC